MPQTPLLPVETPNVTDPAGKAPSPAVSLSCTGGATTLKEEEELN